MSTYLLNLGPLYLYDLCPPYLRPLPFPGPRTGQPLGPWRGGQPLGPVQGPAIPL